MSEIGEALDRYAPLYSTLADLLARVGRFDEAVAAYDREIDLTSNTVEQSFLTRQRCWRGR